MSEDNKKLKKSTYEDRINDGNMIGEVSVYERVDGLGHDLAFYVGYTGIDDSLLVGNAIVRIGNGTRIKTYNLDDGTFLEFDDEEGVATFTSRGVQYRIRPLLESDSSWVVNVGAEESS